MDLNQPFAVAAFNKRPERRKSPSGSKPEPSVVSPLRVLISGRGGEGGGRRRRAHTVSRRATFILRRPPKKHSHQKNPAYLMSSSLSPRSEPGRASVMLPVSECVAPSCVCVFVLCVCGLCGAIIIVSVIRLKPTSLCQSVFGWGGGLQRLF